MKNHRVVIIGGGFGGLSVARRLHALKKDIEIVIVDPRPGHIYTPWLYEVATAVTGDDRVQMFARARRAAEIPFTKLPGFAFTRFILERVKVVDEKHQSVVLQSGTTLRYDALVFAVGSMTNDFGIAGAITYGLPLKTTSDAVIIAERLSTLLHDVRVKRMLQATIMVVGGGANGVELAGEIAAVRLKFLQMHALQPQQIRVVLCNAGKEILGKFPNHVRRHVIRRLRALHVEVMNHAVINAVTSVTVEGEGFVLPYDLLVWTAGVRSLPEVSAWNIALDPRGRIRVDDTFKIVQQKGMFALGDCAACYKDDIPVLDPQSAQAACVQAPILAKNILAFLEGKPAISYKAPYWQLLLAVGGKYGVGNIFGVSIKGRLAYVARRFTDLKYFVSVFPFITAFRIWYRGIDLYASNDPK